MGGIRQHLSIYFLLIAVTSILVFNPEVSPHYWIGFAFVASLYLFPINRIAHDDPPDWYIALVLITTPAFTMLIVIDPVEMGLYGHDPYITTIPETRRMLSGLDPNTFVSRGRNSWPLFYGLASILTLFAPLGNVAKYSPLLTAVLPLLLFIGLRRRIGAQTAGVTALSFASTRTLMMFETKFVDETLAVTLLGLAVATLLWDRNWRHSVIAFIAIFGVGLTHHVISVMLMLVLISWWSLPVVLGFRELPIPQRLQPVPNSDGGRPTGFFTALGGFAAAMVFLYWGDEFLRYTLGSVLISASTGSTREVAGVASNAPKSRAILSSAALIVLIVFALIIAYGFVSHTRYPEWLLGWSAAAGVIATIYAIFLFYGSLVPLAPIRLLIVLMILVQGAGFAIAFTEGIQVFDEHVVALVLVFLASGVVVTQLAAIPPHVLYSNPGETSLTEGHYTPQQWKASEFVSGYGSHEVAALEHGLWGANDVTTVRLTKGENQCDYIQVWRREAHIRPPSTQNLIYSAGDIRLSLC